MHTESVTITWPVELVACCEMQVTRAHPRVPFLVQDTRTSTDAAFRIAISTVRQLAWPKLPGDERDTAHSREVHAAPPVVQAVADKRETKSTARERIQHNYGQEL